MRRLVLATALGVAACWLVQGLHAERSFSLDSDLRIALRSAGFTGRSEARFRQRLGRPIDQGTGRSRQTAVVRHDWRLEQRTTPAPAVTRQPTDSVTRSRSPSGIDNNGIVGPHRTGPRNQRRTPLAINTALYPTLMWNSRFVAVSGDPFDNRMGFQFPPPEGLSLSLARHLLVAQAFIPPTERVEVAGFEFPGDNLAIRDEVVRRLNDVEAYRARFGRVFRDVDRGGPIRFDHFASAIAEFEFTMVFADAPLDRFARGEGDSLTSSQKTGALLFFGRAGCVACHAVAGQSSEMFSDFQQHVIGVPQVAPRNTNVNFDGPGRNEDFGLEQVTGDPSDRYMFRTAPLRNAALMPAFMHNGAFVRLEDAIAHHLDPAGSARRYSPRLLPRDLQGTPGPIEPVLARLDPQLRDPLPLSREELDALVDFVRQGLLDRRAEPQRLRKLVPKDVPSGRPPLRFEFK